MTGDNVADRLKWSPSKVSRYERARTGQKPSEVDKLLCLYGITGTKREEMLDLAGQVARQRHDLDVYRDPLDDYLDEASELRDWSSRLVPRVLQTARYTYGVMFSRQGVLLTMRSEIETSQRTTGRWQARLAPGPVPVPEDEQMELWAVLDESVLYRQVGTPEVMYEQLGFLLQAASWPRVHLHLLPYGAGAGAMAGSFLHVSYAPAWSELPDMSVVLSHMHGVSLVEVEREVWQYQQVFAQLLSAALDEESTADDIKRVREDFWG